MDRGCRSTVEPAFAPCRVTFGGFHFPYINARVLSRSAPTSNPSRGGWPGTLGTLSFPPPGSPLGAIGGWVAPRNRNLRPGLFEFDEAVGLRGVGTWILGQS